MTELTIRPMAEDDLDFAAQCTAAEGWLTETREEFEVFLRYDRQGCLVAEQGEKKVGICIATCYGHKGFIGEVIVLPEMRGKSIGSRLMDRALAYLRSRGCRSVSLDAVPNAVSLYEKFGFRKVCRSFRFAGKLGGSPSPRVRATRKEDLKEVFSLDKRAFAADRSSFLQWRFDRYPDLAKVLISKERISGYIFGRRRSSLVWAGPWWLSQGTDEPAELLHGFACEAKEAEIHLGILECNITALELVRSLGFLEKPSVSWRMVLGAWADGVGHSPKLYAIGTAAKG